jgi:hypothetical protein
VGSKDRAGNERIWLGDGPGAGDPLNIRPDDASGTNWIENWCPADRTKLRKLGFEPDNAGDNYVFSTIRWDLGNDGIDFYVELPIANNNDYLVNLYFNECCCPQRHFKIEMQGAIVDEDVSSANYDPNPGNGKVGRLTFNHIIVDNGILRIGFLPCPDCPGAGDTNAIVNAIEVITNPCADPSFRLCPDNLSCSVNPILGIVTGTWEAPLCFEVAGYEVKRDGQTIKSLPKDAVSFTDRLQARAGFYEVVPLVGAGVEPCPTLSCTAVRDTLPFSVPLRINMGGFSRIDSKGQVWYGDGPGGGDPLGTRVDDLGGANWIENWCVNSSLANADTMQSFGYDPFNPNDQYIFNTIRFDDGNEPTDFRLEIPVENGVYLLSLYFTECCCPNRHFKIEVQGEIVDEDVSSADYSLVPNLGRTGRLSFDGVVVSDGILRIAFLPCLDPECLGGTDGNALIDAIELLPAGTTLLTCPRDLICTLGGDGKVVGTWSPAENVAITGYDVYRDGAKIGSLPGSATQFTDGSPPCHRRTVYEVAPLSDAQGFPCPGMRLKSALINPDCPFSAPLRINMGGVDAVDSHGNTWIGDGPGPGDPLDIRPDDASGTNTIENWCAADETSLADLGFNPNHVGDNYIFSTIRWDVGNDGIDFRLEIPMEDGGYTVNMYFNECCCPARHFKIEIQDVIVDEDVSFLDYDVASPGLGKVGRLSFEGIAVADGFLRIGLLPCTDCPGVLDTNAIIDALEILSSGGPVLPKFHRGDTDDNGQLQLTDAVRILGYLFLGSIAPACLDAADTDDNGQLQLTDAVRILGYLFLGSIPPAPPGPPPSACGTDPTPNDAGTDLGCATHTKC